MLGAKLLIRARTVESPAGECFFYSSALRFIFPRTTRMAKARCEFRCNLSNKNIFLAFSSAVGIPVHLMKSRLPRHLLTNCYWLRHSANANSTRHRWFTWIRDGSPITRLQWNFSVFDSRFCFSSLRLQRYCHRNSSLDAAICRPCNACDCVLK